jgi:hypothetical protein
VTRLVDLSEHVRRATARSATAVVVVLLGATLLLGLPLLAPGAPLGIVSLQLATSPTAAADVLAAWASVPRSRLLGAHALDLVLPLAYGLAIVTVAEGARRTLGRRHLSATIAIGGAVVAVVADQVENLAMWATILSGPSWASVIVTLVGAIVKFVMLSLALGSLVAAFVAVHVRGVSP